MQIDWQALAKVLGVLVMGIVLPACESNMSRAEQDAGPGDTRDATRDAGARDAEDPGRVDPSAFLFEEPVIRDYEFQVDPSQWQWLQVHAREESYVPTTLSFQGASYDNAAIRYKGGGTLRSCIDEMGNRSCAKVSMKVSFNEYDEEGRFFGLKKILFHSMIRDPSNMHDALSYQLLRDIGVAGPRTAFARLTVNGTYLGLFAFVEYVDGRFTRRAFPDGGKGNLYKSAWPDSADASYYLEHLRTNKDESPSAARILRFANQLASAGVAGVSAVARNWQVEEQIMRYMAIARLIGHWDDVGAWYCLGDAPCFNHNFYWYQSTEQDRLWLIPWDMDHTLEPASLHRLRNVGVPEWDDLQASCDPVHWFGDRSIKPPACDLLLRGLAQGSRALYVQYSNELIVGAFSASAMKTRIDTLVSLLEPEMVADPNGGGLAAWHEAVAELRLSVQAKRSFILGRL